MLIHLSIKNFAVVKQLDLNLEQGFTAITGETGAGKSIALDAIGLCLGERADPSSVRPGADKAEIVSHFSLAKTPEARAWLEEHEMLSEDDADTCFIRRVISKEGRSRAFINGSTASLGQLKSLGSKLLAIHGQNTHLALLKEETQRQTLDTFAEHDELLEKVKSIYTSWQSKKQQLVTLQQEKQKRLDKHQLLTYQLKELDEFALEENEFLKLEAEYKRLSHHQHLVEQSQDALYALYESEHHAALAAVQKHADNLSSLVEHDANLESAVSLMYEASAQLEEAVNELRHYTDSLDADPQRFTFIESRYSTAVSLARKHQVAPEQLFDFHATLLNELQRVNNDEDICKELESELNTLADSYYSVSKQLHESRQNAATKLESALLDYLKQMNMPHAQLSMCVNYEHNKTPTPNGMDSVKLLVSVNPGQMPGPLEKTVSGGELSRIGLAVQVIGQSKDSPPTLIFDEVDTGISGPTASIVGHLLKQIGKDQQVISVTHLPQVAAQAHNQLFVSKITNGAETETRVLPLTPQDRIHELARLLAGDTVTDSAIENAKVLLAQAQNAG